MNPPPVKSTSNADYNVLEERLTNVIHIMDEIKSMIGQLGERMTALEKCEAARAGDGDARLLALEKRVQALEETIEESKKDRAYLWRKIDNLGSKLSNVTWIGGIIGSAAILWIVNNLLGLIK